MTKLKHLVAWPFSGILFDVACTSEKDQLVLGSSDFKVYGFDLGLEKPQAIPFTGRGHTSYVTSVVATPEAVVSGSYDGQLIWWDPAARKQRFAIHGHDKWVRQLAVAPDGLWLASVADDMACCVWDATNGQLLHRFTDHEPITPQHYPSMLYAVAISPDSRYLATGDKVGRVVVRDMHAQQLVAELEAPIMYTWDPRQRRHSIGGIRSLAFSPDGQQLAVGGIGTIENIDHLGGPHRLELFDWQGGRRLQEVESSEFKGLVQQITFHPQGDWLLAAGGDNAGFVSLYDCATGKPIQQEKAPMHVHAFVFSEDYGTLVAVGHGKIARWSLG